MCGACVARDYNAARRLNTHTLVTAEEESLSHGIDEGGGGAVFPQVLNVPDW